MITIRIKNRDIELANRYDCYPTQTAIARYLNTSWRVVDFDLGGKVNIYSEDDALEGVYSLSKDDEDLISEIHKEWNDNREYFLSMTNETFRFHIKKD